MQDAIINYIPELIGGTFIAILTFVFTRINEKSKAKTQLENQKHVHENEKDKIKIEYDAKLREQELKLNHERELLEKLHQQEIEKYKMQNQDKDLRSLFTGEYDVSKIGEQMEGLEVLMEQVDKWDKKMKSGNVKKANHPILRKKKN
ncbi:hypothetical protein RYX56_06265 [Alkalihalophilus lindianensis]|uniref:Holin n=1 Tax=Alkalihalophilus lindianensis TaxID=1630542 RepID=A0ABU3X7V8_9BACI|nr:hypothetical protein [Alkalihalophilus lindianensis]MDV2683977.1 hypothetical protein [Alkalihalophilus lindianensis]